MKNKFWILGVLLINIYQGLAISQSGDSIWTLKSCIVYALHENVSVQQTALKSETSLINLEQARASRFPSVSASASENLSWGRDLDSNYTYGSYRGTDGTNLSISSNVRLYNGFKTEYSIRQQELSYNASQYDIETIKESVSLNILDAYLQVLYAEEQLKNAEKQIESTTEQLKLAEERLTLGAIAKSDYLLIKSELASEKLTLTNSQNLVITSKVTLMQLMELPVRYDFNIEHPDFGDIIYKASNISTDSLYNKALEIKPQIKSSEINQQMAELEIQIAKAAYQPSLSLGGGISTGYSSGNNMAFDYQVYNKISPNIGLSLSIPIYQNKQTRSGVAKAKIGSQTAELETINTKNQLRKEIEQACANVLAAEKKYEASFEQFKAKEEAYNVAYEKYSVGLINSVDFLIQKTDLINSESSFLQSKYNLVFSNKILDFYLGKSLSF